MIFRITRVVVATGKLDRFMMIVSAGTISIIVDDYKAGLDNLDLDSFRELSIEAKKGNILRRSSFTF
jgi:hypothetical protein